MKQTFLRATPLELLKILGASLFDAPGPSAEKARLAPDEEQNPERLRLPEKGEAFYWGFGHC